MIAVCASETDAEVVSEFFELFKTEWEPHSPSSRAGVLLCSTPTIPPNSARLVIAYGSAPGPHDQEGAFQCRHDSPPTAVSYHGHPIPILGNLLTFDPAPASSLVDPATGRSVTRSALVSGQRVVRVGYDLFAEIRRLLTEGQPAMHAACPTVEWHIAILRDSITSHSIPIVEIPPVPDGCSFIACLTHDADHVGIRNHRADHTLAGFLFRATIGSALNLLRGRLTPAQLLANWSAALSLPLVHLGLARDFWFTFDRYRKLEAGRPSTFFILPRKGDPGRARNGRTAPHRAAPYDAASIAPHLHRLRDSGSEIGLHGIDAWAAADMGREEKDRIAQTMQPSVAPVTGVRMHWLYFDEKSPAALEEAGFTYDSTVGYNETVGYRAGTTQVYKPPGVQRLLELPMHIMDTALFYPRYLNISPLQPSSQVTAILDHAARFGGVVTVNWHDRSIAPERLWDTFYTRLLDDLTRRGAWFASAADTVAWFSHRRSASIRSSSDATAVNASISVGDRPAHLPRLVARCHQQPQAGTTQPMTTGFTQAPVPQSGRIRFPLAAPADPSPALEDFFPLAS